VETKSAPNVSCNLQPTSSGCAARRIVAAALRGRREGMFVIDKMDHLARPVERRGEVIRRLQIPRTIPSRVQDMPKEYIFPPPP